MELELIDWTLIVLFLLVSLGIGLKFKNKAGKNLTEYFLGGRNLPWYIAGVSMVATTFAADTPLAVTELVNQYGISGNWLWWNMLIGGTLTTFFFANLWRRSGVLTELEFIELRYSGKAASFLRGFKAVYLGIFINTLIIGWVNLAFVSILKVFFDLPENQILLYTAIAMLIAAIYSSISGLKGVAVTDVIQFIIAMTGSILLAIFVIKSEDIGGIQGLQNKLPAETFRFFPTLNIHSPKSVVSTLSISLGTFIAYIGIQWWASWYPGAEPGGGGYIAQRMMSAKNEKHAVWSTLFFQIAHYALRPWPWILVGMACVVLYPELGVDDKKLGYVMAIKDYMPIGLKGLMLVALLAAYMSTISTQLNWGTSYVINDLYRRFIKKEKIDNTEKDSKHYVLVSRITTLIIMFLGLYITTLIKSISGVWVFLIECGAGLGLVLILRWFWWRINAWSEITATIIPYIAYAISKYLLNLEFPDSFFITVSIATVAWVIITFITPSNDIGSLEKFCDKVKPYGNWKIIKNYVPKSNNYMNYLFISWISSIAMIYSILFATGKLLFRDWQPGFIWLSISIISLKKINEQASNIITYNTYILIFVDINNFDISSFFS